MTYRRITSTTSASNNDPNYESAMMTYVPKIKGQLTCKLRNTPPRRWSRMNASRLDHRISSHIVPDGLAQGSPWIYEMPLALEFCLP